MNDETELWSSVVGRRSSVVGRLLFPVPYPLFPVSCSLSPVPCLLTAGKSYAIAWPPVALDYALRRDRTSLVYCQGVPACYTGPKSPAARHEPRIAPICCAAEEEQMQIKQVGMTRNHFEPGNANRIRMVVMHSTAGTAPGDYNWLRQGGSDQKP